MNWQDYIEQRPDVMLGKPVFKGTRLTSCETLQKHWRDVAYVAFERYQRHQESLSRRHSLRYRFMAQIGKDHAKAFDEIQSVVHCVLFAARMLWRLWAEQSQAGDASRQSRAKSIAELEAILWYQGDADPIVKEVDAVINRVEDVCRPIITRWAR